MRIYKNYDLTELNTFRVKASAKFFVEIESEADLVELFNLPEFKENKKMFLGGGSNVLFTKDFEGMVVLNKLKGVEILSEDSEEILIRAMGGEIWHDFVMFVVNHGYWGVENLALIPGTIGAAPIQNIGAYGSELKDALLNVETFEVETGSKKIFNKEECELGYRDSVFKNKLKGKYFISSVVFKLNKKRKDGAFYKTLAEFVEKNKIEVKKPKDISDAVIFVRQSKLPDPKIIGNAGSFFKNVFVDKNKIEFLFKIYPDIPYFEENNLIKIPAGWLIEQCGWKGKKVGNVGVYEKQALVLVNYGGASSEEILDLSNKIIESVKEKFGVELQTEVNLI